MRIDFVLGSSNPFPGAAWTRIGFFADNWSSKGHDVAVLGSFSYTTLKKIHVRAIRKTKIFNIIPNINLTSPVFFIFNFLASFVISTCYLTARRPRILIVSLPTGDVGLGALLASRLTSAKVVVDYRDEWEDYTVSIVDSRMDKKLFSSISKFSALLYAKSKVVTVVTPNFLFSLMRRGVTNVMLMPNGADVTVFYPHNKYEVRKKLKLDEADFIIVYDGLIGAYYKLDVIIKALARLRVSMENFKFLIIGDGPDLRSILDLSNDLGLSDKVVYMGVVNSASEMAEILSAGDVGVIPSLYTKGQLPVKFFEYCACSIPVIAVAPDDSFLSQIINEYKVGKTVSSMDEVKVADAFYQFYLNDSFRVSAGETAISLIKKKFDRNKISDRFLTLLESLR